MIKIILTTLLIALVAACAVPARTSQDEQGVTCSGSPYCNPYIASRNGNGPDKVQMNLDHSSNSDWVCILNCDDDGFGAYCPDPTVMQILECDQFCHPQPQQYQLDCYIGCYNQIQTRCASGEVP